MRKFRSALPVKHNTLTSIDSLGNLIADNGDYYLHVCPSCGCKNLPHAIGSGRCYRCDYKLTYKDEEVNEPDISHSN